MRFTGINLAKVNANEWFGSYTGNYLEQLLGGQNNEASTCIC